MFGGYSTSFVVSFNELCGAVLCMLIYLKAEGHDLASQTVASEERLHGVSQLHLFREHIPEKLVEQVPGVEQRHQHPSQLVLQATPTNSQPHFNLVILWPLVKYSDLHTHWEQGTTLASAIAIGSSP